MEERGGLGWVGGGGGGGGWRVAVEGCRREREGRVAREYEWKGVELPVGPHLTRAGCCDQGHTLVLRPGTHAGCCDQGHALGAVTRDTCWVLRPGICTGCCDQGHALGAVTREMCWGL